MYQGNIIKIIVDQSWADCTESCRDLSSCAAFSYHAAGKICIAHSKIEGDAVYKENFVFSRPCGTTEFNCPKSECRSCQTTGYTTESESFDISAKTAIRTVRVDTELECAQECDSDVYCISFSFKPGSCTLRSANIGERRFSQYFTFHRKCGTTDLNCTGLDD